RKGGEGRRKDRQTGPARLLGRRAGLFRGYRGQSLGGGAQSGLPLGRGRAYLASGMNHDTYDNSYISGILNSVKSVAIVGASANDVRPSFFVTKYLIDKGYTVFPVNPGQAGKEILGRPVYAKLADIPEPIDMVDVFRPSAAVPGIVEEVLALDPLPKVVWTQVTIRHDEAAARAEAAGIKVGMNRCPKIEYARLSGEISWNGVNSRVISSKKPLLRQGFQSFGIRQR